MSTVEQTADSLTVRLTTAETGIDTAQTAANNAATAAGNAQSTANTARNEAATAAKTATNYLNFSSAGLIVGDMTASTLGKNVLIYTGGVNIRDGSTVLASFTESKIQLGVNSSSSVIELCGSSGVIQMDKDYNGIDVLRFKASNISVMANPEEGTAVTSMDARSVSNAQASLHAGIKNSGANDASVVAETTLGGSPTVTIGVNGSGNISQITVLPTKISLSSNTISANGNIVLSAMSQAVSKAIKWAAINSKNPYIGYATDQTDGTFVVASLLGTNYASGLAIDGGSGNLLYKANVVLHAGNYTSYAATAGHTHSNYAPIGHTHNYAGSSSAGGAATKAVSDQNGNQIDRIYCSMIPFGTTVAANSNLNTTAFLKVGNYYCSANATVKTLTNCPTSSAFMMQVYSPLSTTIDNESTKTWCYRLRKLMTYTGEEYIQYVYSGSTAGSFTYGAWKKVLKSNDTALSDLGITATAAELNYLSGVTSNIQTQLNNKLGTSGGMIAGALNVTGNFTVSEGSATLRNIELHSSTPYIDFHYGRSTEDFTSRIIESAIGSLNLYSGNSVRMSVENEFVGLYNSTDSAYSAHFRPGTDGKCTLGIAAQRWYAVYSTNGSIQTSDRREKENIMPIGIEQMMFTDEGTKLVDLHSELFDRLKPVQYNFINGNGKIAYGLIAQDVIEAMHEIGIDENKLDLVHHDFWTDEKTKETTDTYGLGYTNLLALLIHEVQKLKAEVKALKYS